MPQALRQEGSDIAVDLGRNIGHGDDLVAVDTQHLAAGQRLDGGRAAAAIDQRHLAEALARAEILDQLLCSDGTLVDAGLAGEQDEQMMILFAFADRVIADPVFDQFGLRQQTRQPVLGQSAKQVGLEQQPQGKISGWQCNRTSLWSSISCL